MKEEPDQKFVNHKGKHSGETWWKHKAEDVEGN